MANTSELTADLLEQAERTRRLSIAIRSDLTPIGSTGLPSNWMPQFGGDWRVETGWFEAGRSPLIPLPL
jgi:hypothetical protein